MLKSDFQNYIQTFNEQDCETVVNMVPNKDAYAYLAENAPRLSCPDKIIEGAFSFRTWTVRKHLRKTEDGVMMTEFLPDVSWAGQYNTINAPLFHHLNEYRWFKNAEILLDYLFWFLENKGGNAYVYSTPALTAAYEFLVCTGNEALLKEKAECFERYFLGWEERHLTECGLYRSYDGYDAMEFSISGTDGDGTSLPGLRPTLNGYLYGDCVTLSRIFALVGNSEKSDFYHKKAEKIKALIDEKLYDGEFYKAIHGEEVETLSLESIPLERNVRELLGYIPFIYRMPSKEKVSAFRFLKDEKVFAAPTGFTTADRSHPRYLYSTSHECMWNGYVWPFATSQTLNAVIAVLEGYEQKIITNADLLAFLHTYAKMHCLKGESGEQWWIDEVMHPENPVWTAREQLKNGRGKDYNHSTFIDLVLRGLIGVDPTAKELTVKPRVLGLWDWFSVENLTFRGKTYDLFYDENGKKFGKGKGLFVCKNDGKHGTY